MHLELIFLFIVKYCSYFQMISLKVQRVYYYKMYSLFLSHDMLHPIFSSCVASQPNMHGFCIQRREKMSYVPLQSVYFSVIQIVFGCATRLAIGRKISIEVVLLAGNLL
jgi:hypothetical protein